MDSCSVFLQNSRVGFFFSTEIMSILFNFRSIIRFKMARFLLNCPNSAKKTFYIISFPFSLQYMCVCVVMCICFWIGRTNGKMMLPKALQRSNWSTGSKRVSVEVGFSAYTFFPSVLSAKPPLLRNSKTGDFEQLHSTHTTFSTHSANSCSAQHMKFVVNIWNCIA